MLMSRLFNFTLCVVAMSWLFAPSSNAQDLAVDSLDQAARDSLAVTTDCDTDFDGAVLGSAIGSIPVWVTFIGGTDESEAGMFILGVIGAVAGFWIGLAVDSTDCEDPRAGRSRYRDRRSE